MGAVIGRELGVIDIDSGNTVRSLASDESDVPLDAAFDARSQTLAISYASGALELVDLRSGERRIRRGAHDPRQVPGGVQVALDPSGATLYSLSDDGTALMWNVATFEPIGPALTAPSPLSSFSPLDLALTPDGKTLVAAGGELVRWNIGGSLVEPGCAVANRNLTEAEWGRYFSGSAEYRKTCTGLP